MYILTDSSRTNRSGFPVITSVRTDVVWNKEGSQSGWIYIPETDGDDLSSIVNFSFLYPFQHSYQHGPFAYNSGTVSGSVSYFYDNKDVYCEYNLMKFEESHSRLLSPYTTAQRAGWDTKESLLRQYQGMTEEQKSGAVDQPAFTMLKYEAQGRGITLDSLITNYIAPKADYFAMKHGLLYGRQKNLETQILAASGTPEQIMETLEAMTIDYSDII